MPRASRPAIHGAAGTYIVTLTVRDDRGASATASRAVTVARAPPPPRVRVTRTRIVGGYRGVTRRLTLPRTLAPGSYAISIGGVAVAGRFGRVTIAAPPQGILRRAFVSSRPNGTAAAVFPRTTRQLYCTFGLAALPARGRARALSTAWRVRGGTLERVSKPRARRVSGVVARSGPSFPPGRHTCTLRSGSTVVATVGARIR